MIGGLMSQYAAINHKPIIGFTDDDFYSFNDTEDLLQTKIKGKLVKTTLDEFHLELNHMIKNENIRIDNIEITKNCVITPERFTELLYQNISNPQNIESEFTDHVKINLNSIFDLYVDLEVNFLKLHYIYIWKVLKSEIFLDNIYIGITFFIIRLKFFIKLRIGNYFDVHYHNSFIFI